eukprot:TRINITY_DN5516_c0_g2_i1.p1 TRINITY_DN5516_c0_g2~~TRINITY_DN5516_c0_g2_i1.p1  ORF type:complete len:928 (+),score=244.21 TRINITY_DN5516_c0_g2_i1:411-2786(+)
MDEAPPEEDGPFSQPPIAPQDGDGEDNDGDLAPPEVTDVPDGPETDPPEAPEETDVGPDPGGIASSPSKLPMALNIKGRRKALTIGINYIGHKVGQLKGCINDSDTFISILTEQFGYNVSDIRQLRDDNEKRMPTRKNMIAALSWLVSGAKPGDHLFFHFSGHGSQAKDSTGDEMDGMDETLVPCDYKTAGMFSDDELRKLVVTPLPKGVRLTCVLDCCHSGSLMDLSYKVSLGADNATCSVKKKQTSNTTPEKCSGEVVMLSGCMDEQCSADIGSTASAKAAGALTSAFKAVISKKPDSSVYQLLSNIREYLKKKKFPQVPQISYEHHLNLSEAFLPECQADDIPATLSRPPTKRALTIGINYLDMPQGKGRLSGCINDSDTIVELLKDTFGFQDSQICRLRDDKQNMMPTKQNMLASMAWLTQGAAPGDEMFFHFSGHGSQQADSTGDEEDGKDETLVPTDFQKNGMVTDDELYGLLVKSLPKGCRMWVILDCCHSGTALDLPWKAAVCENGKDMELKCVAKNREANASKADVIMISGCEDNQTSGDVGAGHLGNERAAGAMTTALRNTLTPEISCEDLMMKMRTYLKKNGFAQVPQMSSEQFLSLDSSYVRYSQHGTRDIGGQAAPPAAPMAPVGPPMAPSTNHYAQPHATQVLAPHMMMPPGGMPPMPHPGMYGHGPPMGMPPAAAFAGTPPSPMMYPGAMPFGGMPPGSPMHSMPPMHGMQHSASMPTMATPQDLARISQLEDQIAQLRYKVNSPQPGGGMYPPMNPPSPMAPGFPPANPMMGWGY